MHNDAAHSVPPSPRGSGERVARAQRGLGEGHRATQILSQLGLRCPPPPPPPPPARSGGFPPPSAAAGRRARPRGRPPPPPPPLRAERGQTEFAARADSTSHEYVLVRAPITPSEKTIGWHDQRL